ncbi:hypothetical protein L596_015292 [Steinernema carpocapsae]|uniref:C-type lectin domain-containing protein n=1 Tax=Steinernema carpocapsae TaxID=34508 RepID=A0A4U5NFK1_STECR|nr:hypothetical protein L596_015292 [Steinernema carpocapsae]
MHLLPTFCFLLSFCSVLSSNSCPLNSIPDPQGHKCYRFFKTQRSHRDAEEFCREFDGSLAILPNSSVLLENLKERAGVDKCLLWIGSSTQTACVLMLNWALQQKIEDCTFLAPFLCEFQPTCAPTSYFSTTIRYTTPPTSRILTTPTVDPWWKSTSIHTSYPQAVTLDNILSSQRPYIQSCAMPPSSMSACQASVKLNTLIWVTFQNSEYLFSNDSKTWFQAENFCKKNGGHLASIHSECEFNFIAANICDRYVWIGGIERNGIYMWSDRTPWDYHNIARLQTGQYKDSRIDIYWSEPNNASSRMMNYLYATFPTAFVCKKTAAK